MVFENARHDLYKSEGTRQLIFYQATLNKNTFNALTLISAGLSDAAWILTITCPDFGALGFGASAITTVSALLSAENSLYCATFMLSSINQRFD